MAGRRSLPNHLLDTAGQEIENSAPSLQSFRSVQVDLTSSARPTKRSLPSLNGVQRCNLNLSSWDQVGDPVVVAKYDGNMKWWLWRNRLVWVPHRLMDGQPLLPSCGNRNLDAYVRAGHPRRGAIIPDRNVSYSIGREAPEPHATRAGLYRNWAAGRILHRKSYLNRVGGTSGPCGLRPVAQRTRRIETVMPRVGSCSFEGLRRADNCIRRLLLRFAARGKNH